MGMTNATAKQIEDIWSRLPFGDQAHVHCRNCGQLMGQHLVRSGDSSIAAHCPDGSELGSEQVFADPAPAEE